MLNEIVDEIGRPLPTSVDGVYKADLHVHIGALAMGKTMRRLAEKYNLPMDELAPFFKLQKWPSLLAFHQEYERFYGKLLREPQDYYDVVYEYLMQAAKHNTLYVELSASLRPLTNGRISNEDMLTAIGKAFADAKRDAAEAGYEPIEAGLIANTIRDMGPGHAMWVAEEAARLKKDFPFIYGFGMSGDENHPTPLREYKAAFQYAHENGLGCTMHAGETSVKTLIESVEELGEYLQRIGHGIHAMKDIKILDKYIRKHPAHRNKFVNPKKRPHCVLEFCPTSYEKLGSWKNSMKSLVHTLWNRGFRITLGSDDPGPMRTSIWHEYLRMHKEFSMRLWQLAAITHASIKYSFAPDDIKERLLRKTHAQKHGLYNQWLAKQPANTNSPPAPAPAMG